MATGIAAATQSRPNVAFVRPELAALLPQYMLIRDCLAGEVTVKAKRTAYLPMPDAADQSTENQERYKAYLLRAVFYNVTRRTMSGLIGQVFMRDPIIKVPTQLEKVNEDATGSGVSLTQSAKKSLSLTLAYSRSGLFMDYPDTQGGVTAEQEAEGEIRPTMNTYSPQEIINWRVIERGAKEVLALVVLAESYVYQDDGFEMKHSCQFRVLRLDAQGEYVQEIWREEIPRSYTIGEPAPTTGNFISNTIVKPRDPNGKALREIPFTFIGSENNDSSPDNPNMYDLASLNIAHYRNSADYEEGCFIVGQPTVVLTGISEEWNTNVLKGKINFGSRGGIPLPVGGNAELLQADENTMLKEAMDTKERQMVALGAKLVEQKEVQRTATEASIEATAEGSVLSSTTKNVEKAYQYGLEWCAMMQGAAGEVKIELNTDFDLANLTPEEVAAAVKAWQDGALTWKEMRAQLKRANLATEDDEKAKADIQSDQTDQMNMAINEAGGIAVATNLPDPNPKPAAKVA